MYKLKAFLLGIFVSFSSPIFVYAQTGISPYSIRGVGDFGSMELPNHIGMGNVGIGMPQNLYLNNVNPALLPYNTLTHFGLGIMSDYKRISGQNTSTTNLGGGLSYITFSFPIISGTWTLSSGLIPYSSVNYNYKVKGSTISGTESIVDYDYRGEGGISRAYIANGISLNKNFAVGIQLNYLFGSIIKETGTQIIDEEISSTYRTVLYDRTRFSDLSLKGGFSFNQQVRSRTFFSAGLIYELETNVNAEQLKRLERRNLVNGTTWESLSIDTVSNVEGSVRLPSSLGFGVSLFRSYNWSIGSDLTLSKGSSFRDFDGNNLDLVDGYRLAVGGEYTPEISSIDNYLKRMTYRFGVNYEKTPYFIKDEQVRDFGINFGTSLPVSRFSSLDMAFRLGRRGTLSNDLIKEDYFRVYLGVTFNDKWFQRRKYD